MVADAAEIVGVVMQNGRGPKIFARVSSSVLHPFLTRLATMEPLHSLDLLYQPLSIMPYRN